MKLVGLVVNPIAGMGGRVGLKGTDGKDILRKARELGSIPEAPIKAKRALQQLLPIKEKIKFLVASGDMGETIVKDLGFAYEVIYSPQQKETDETDTYALSKQLEENKVELIIFVGLLGNPRILRFEMGSDVEILVDEYGVEYYRVDEGSDLDE